MSIRHQLLTWYHWKRKIGHWGKDIRVYGIPGSIKGGNNIHIGNNCRLNSGIVLNATGSEILIGDSVTISSNSQIIAATYDVEMFMRGERNAFKHIHSPIVIGNHVWICAGAIILPGVKIADNVIIAAGTVVTRSIEEEYVLVAGNPGKIIKRYDGCLSKMEEEADGFKNK